MKRIYLLIFAFIFIFAGFGMAHITTREPKPVKQFSSCYAEEVESCKNDDCSICVIGRASKKLTSDCAYMLIRIEKSDANIFSSQNACYEVYNDIISKVNEFNISRENFCEHGIVSRQCRVEPAEYKTVFDFEIKVCELDKIGEIENKINETDDCKIFDLRYTYSSLNDEYENVLNEAIENAQQKANELLHRNGQKVQIVAQNVFSSSGTQDIEIKAMVEIMYK